MARLVGRGYRWLRVGSVATLLAPIAFTADQALSRHVTCGTILTQNTNLDSDLIDCPVGIVLDSAPINHVLGLTLRGNLCGINLSFSHNNLIEKNQALHSGLDGIRLGFSDNRIDNNQETVPDYGDG